jgi:hypothetical protein
MIKNLMLIVALTLGFSFDALAQAAPDVPDSWQLSATVPGVVFPLTGTTPIKLLAGAGVQETYLFNKLRLTLPGAKTPVPVFGIGGFVIESLTLGPNTADVSTLAGPELLLFDAFALGCGLNVISGGSSGLQSIMNSFTWKNITPTIFYSIPVL